MCKMTLAVALLLIASPCSGFAQDIATPLSQPTRPAPPGVLHRAIVTETARAASSKRFLERASARAQQPAGQRRSVLARHPILFGTLIGFGAGFLVGYVGGDDGVFDDYTAGFNGIVVGGIGAGIGAGVGAAVGAATR